MFWKIVQIFPFVILLVFSVKRLFIIVSQEKVITESILRSRSKKEEKQESTKQAIPWNEPTLGNALKNCPD